MGVGVVELDGDEVVHLSSITINAPARRTLSERLAKIFSELERVMGDWAPDAVAIEQPFVGKNVRAALAVGQAQAVAMVVAAMRGVPVSTYSPSQVKQAVTDYGGSSKEQVREMVQAVLHLEEPPETADASDALAVALCHINASRVDRLVLME